MRILLVDDDRRARRTLRHLLQLCSFQVFEADNGLDALALLDGREMDVILTDCHMPEIDGMTMTRRLRQAGRTTPVVMLSGDGDPTVRRQAAAAGVNAFVDKPFDPDQLMSLLHEVAGHLACAG